MLFCFRHLVFFRNKPIFLILNIVGQLLALETKQQQNDEGRSTPTPVTLLIIILVQDSCCGIFDNYSSARLLLQFVENYSIARFLLQFIDKYSSASIRSVLNSTTETESTIKLESYKLVQHSTLGATDVPNSWQGTMTECNYISAASVGGNCWQRVHDEFRRLGRRMTWMTHPTVVEMGRRRWHMNTNRNLRGSKSEIALTIFLITIDQNLHSL